jgi:hypothetical protein
MRTSTITTTLFSLISLVAAAPTIPAGGPEPRSASHELAARDSSEFIYLADCQRWSTTDGYKASFGLWYANSGTPDISPSAISNEYRDWSNNGYWLNWNGPGQQEIHWPDGTVLYTHILDNGLSVGFGQYAGFAWRWNNGWTEFYCFRDNDRNLFGQQAIPYDPDGGAHDALTCQTRFWCHL